jgi:hypothetical protein
MSLNCGHYRTCCSSPRWYMSMESDTDRGNPISVPLGLPQIPHGLTRRREPGPPQREAGNYLSHGTALDTFTTCTCWSTASRSNHVCSEGVTLPEFEHRASQCSERSSSSSSIHTSIIMTEVDHDILSSSKQMLENRLKIYHEHFQNNAVYDAHWYDSFKQIKSI